MLNSGRLYPPILKEDGYIFKGWKVKSNGHMPIHFILGNSSFYCAYLELESNRRHSVNILTYQNLPYGKRIYAYNSEGQAYLIIFGGMKQVFLMKTE